MLNQRVWTHVIAHTLFLLPQVSAIHSPFANAIPFSPGFNVSAVLERAVSLPSHSWEFGTASEALLELFDAPYSVFGANPFPVPLLNPESTRSLVYAKEKIVIGIPPNGLSDGDGAVGDPASLGVSAVLLGQTDVTYTAAAKAEIDYLLSGAPRWPNGAISHRADHPELWADFIYMAPPFMAYYGVATNNASILREAVEQCLLYPQVLRANTTTDVATPPSSHPASASGLWTHIFGPFSDPGIWSTGNGWAAAGMMRVLAALVKAPPSLFFVPYSASSSNLPDAAWRRQAISSLVTEIRKILDGAMRMQMDQGLLLNYLDDPTWFGEISGSTLLASVAYRLSTHSALLGASALSPSVSSRYIQWAENIRLTLGNNAHITSNGTATPAINPLDWNDRTPFTSGSPEGNNFVILLYSAWRDCVKAGIRGCSVY
ncbi:Unsaturated rhamnogalacturonyl hydrolase YesR [Psilocybe cubensis]|uniref:Unsaturated rhamnogalacturonyl hydrolase YesR n=2 Tax=Psilocybe cubensis TaxID=181762 RepID=A0ACB8GQU8_PSICU|nr:Unsaturated rhamnogalacturonyl hydrolase YesR [Psilocybe cubensis]KAH9477596.1 Unsaturated rhamnogalacturonyl hydrolase YesR [Psilocybe cubensis]